MPGQVSLRGVRAALRAFSLLALIVFSVPAFASAASYREEVLADGPYAYYTFDGSSPTQVNDLSGNGRTLSGSGSITMREPGAIAGSKSALLSGGYFLGSSAYPTSPQGDYTMEAWVRPASTSTAGNVAPIVANSGIASFCWAGAFIYQTDARANAMHANACNADATADPSTTWPDTATWRHVVMRRSNGVGTLWVDGVQVGSALTGIAPAISGQFAVGAIAGWGGGYVGHIDDVSYFDRPLSDARIAAHFAGRSMLAPAPDATVAPTIGGQARQYEQLTGSLGTWTNTPETYTRRWQREGAAGYWADIPGATSATYEVSAEDLGRRLRLRVAADNGQEGVAYSEPTVAVQPSAPTNLSPATLSGSAPVGKIVKAARGTWRGSPTITYAYEWLTCTTSDIGSCATTSGASEASYVVQATDSDRYLRARVTASNGGGSAISTTTALRMGSDYGTAVQSSGPQGFFRYNTTAGAVPNEVAGVGPATLYGAPVRTDPGRSGASGDQAVTFNGTGGNFVDWTFPDPNVAVGGANTLQAWLYINPTTGFYQIMGGHPANLIYYPAGDCFGFNSESECFGTSTAGLAGGWHHITAVFSNGSIYGSKLYIDGVRRTLSERLGGGSRGGSLTQGDPYKIIRVGALRFVGYAGDGVQGAFNGKVDDFAIYNRELTPAEIADQYSMTITDETAPSNVHPPQVPVATLLAGDSVTVADDAWIGKQAVNKTYAWQRNTGSGWTTIPSATEATYTPSVTDVGATLRASVTATNTAGATTATSNATTQVLPAVPPVNTSTPQISGEPTQGHLLIAHGDAWTSSLSYERTYQWQRSENGVDWSDIGSATSSSQYQLGTVDGGKQLRVIVTATSPIGATSATSAATAAVGSGSPANTSPPTVSGIARFGSVLGGDVGQWTSEGGGTVSYAGIWQREATPGDWQDIPGATGPYAPTAADIDKRLRIKVTATNAFGSTVAYSAATDIVADITPVNVVAPALAGQARSGQTITAHEGAWSSAATPSTVLTWQRDSGSGWQTIAHSGPTIDLDDTDIGTRLRIAVTATTALGSAQAVSAPTDVISARPVAVLTPPVLTGQVTAGQTLTAAGGSWSGSQPLAVSYRWERLFGSSWRPIANATSSSWVVPAGGDEYPVRAVVTATNASLHGGTTAVHVTDPLPASPLPGGGIPRVRVTDSYEIENQTVSAPVRCLSGGATCTGATRVILPSTGQVLDTQSFALPPSQTRVIELTLSSAELHAAEQAGYLLVEARTPDSLTARRLYVGE